MTTDIRKLLKDPSLFKEEAFIMDLFYDKSNAVEPISERTPIFRNIHISNVTASNVKKAGTIRGITEMPIQNISFSNININAQEGFTVNTVKNFEFHDVKVNTSTGSSFELEDTSNFIMDNVATASPIKDIPVIHLKNAFNGMVNNNFPMVLTPLFIQAEGKQTREIFLKNNVFTNVTTVVKKELDLNKKAVIE